ncbi:uncharacterized protein RAG0_14382 [Rhynchosporium agropyri]|uniref:Uncharacterized protein n=1 Tax=Rhynchosporium agropyri TaxID=914238 RepID=A0A1E1LH09_9HELO|nr:uncharacterized protein RAG0_14382 [Rhynchosporium agropyri]
MMPLRSHPYLIIGCVAASALLLISLRGHGPAVSTPSKWAFSSPPISTKTSNFRSASVGIQIDTTSEVGRASSRTFGSQKILVIGLPERSDKRDQFVLSASLRGFQVEFLDALKADQVLHKARPPVNMAYEKIFGLY